MEFGEYRMNIHLLRSVACLLFAVALNVNATVIGSDRTTTDYSNDRFSPTDLGQIGLGSYEVLGHLSSSDYDFFVVDFSGFSIESIELTEWSSNYNADWWVYINDHNSMDLNQSVLNQNLLDLLDIHISGSQLTLGTQTGGLTLDYAFSITTAPEIPLPAAVWLFGSGLGLLGWMRRKPAA
jgi:hypothetical protein